MLRLLAFICTTLLLISGCAAPLKNAPTMEGRIKDKYPQYKALENTAPPAVVCFFEHPDGLADIYSQPFAAEPVTVVNSGGESLENMLALIQKQVTPLLVATELRDVKVGMLDVRKMPFHQFLRYIKGRYNVDISYDKASQIIKIQKYQTRKIVLPPILNSPKGTIGSGDSVSVTAEPDNLKDFITTAAESIGVKIVSFSETTGVIQYRGRPTEMEEFTRVVEQEATERLKFVTIHIMVLNVGVDNGFQKDLQLNYIPELSFLGENIYGTFKFALPSPDPITKAGEPVFAPGNVVTPTSLAEGLTSAVVSPTGDKFSALLGLVEKWGTSEVVQAPAFMTSNGVPVSFKVVEETGYWQPGELDITEATDNAPRVIRENRPEFVSEEVGLKLIIRPKIIRDQISKKQLVELDISLEDSSIIGNISTTWQRESTVDPVTMIKPLKSTKVLSSRAILNSDEMLMLARMDRKSSKDSKTGLPGTLNESGKLGDSLASKSIAEKDTRMLIIINAVLPKD